MRFLRWLQVSFNCYAPGAGSFLPWAGGVLLFLAAISAAHSWYFHRTAERSSAVITENVAEMTQDVGVVYYPRFRFRTSDGSAVQVLAKEGAGEAEFAAGSIVPVLYPAQHPERAILATTWRIYWIAIVLAVLGVVVFDIGLVLRIVLRRNSVARGI